MKVICEYCGSYVEADENMKCPLCCAELGSAVHTEHDRLAQAEEAERKHEAQTAAQDAKETHISEIIQGLTSVATALAAGTALSDSTDAPPSKEWSGADGQNHRAHPPHEPHGRDGELPAHFGEHGGKHPTNSGMGSGKLPTELDGRDQGGRGQDNQAPGGHGFNGRGHSRNR